MAVLGKSAAYLRKLRKKHHLGEFSKRRKKRKVRGTARKYPKGLYSDGLWFNPKTGKWEKARPKRRKRPTVRKKQSTGKLTFPKALQFGF